MKWLASLGLKDFWEQVIVDKNKLLRKIQEMDNELIRNIEKTYGFKLPSALDTDLRYELSLYSWRMLKLLGAEL